MTNATFTPSFEKKIGYHISWWVAFFLIFIIVGAATAGSIYAIFSEILPIIATLPTFAPFIAQYILPVLTLPGASIIVQLFTHSAFLFSFIMWGRIYFNDAVTLLQRLFSSEEEIFIKDLNKLLKDLVFIDLVDEKGKDVSKDAAYRLQHIQQGLQKHAALLHERLLTHLNTLPKATTLTEKTCIKSMPFMIMTDLIDSITQNPSAFSASSHELILRFTDKVTTIVKKKKEELAKALSNKTDNEDKISDIIDQFKNRKTPRIIFQHTLQKKETNPLNPTQKKNEKPTLFNWFASLFFAVAVAGFNFTANLTAGILLLNINKITNLQAIQATVLQNFSHLGAFAQGLGILGGAVTALVLVPFLLNFIKKGLQQKNARTKITQAEDGEGDEQTYPTVHKNSKTTNIKKSAMIYVYEVICVINSFLVNSFGVAFGALAILSTALSAIRPGLQLSFPWVISITVVSCFAGALAAMTMTRTNTINAVKTLFDKPVQIPSKEPQKQEVKWYAKIPRLFTTIANIIVLCGFTLSPTSYLSVLFGASSYVRLAIATILIPCIWSLTNKIFKADDLKIQQSIDSASSTVLKTFSDPKPTAIKPEGEKIRINPRIINR